MGMATATQTLDGSVGAERLTVAVVSEDPDICMRAAEILRRRALTVCAEVATVGELDATAHVDVVVLRAGCRGSEVFAAFASARAKLPGTHLVGLWPTGERRDDARAFRCGVDGLLPETQLSDSLVAAVCAVSSGLVCRARTMIKPEMRSPLSNREKQVLGMVVMGFTNCEIASRLFVAESTVKSHLSAAFRKLGVRSRNEAASLILDPQGSLGPGILAITGGD